MRPNDIARLTDLDALVALRRNLHAHPELKFEEVRTADLLAERLEKAGLEVHRGMGRTGVVATLRGKSDRAIILRADMDALPITETSGAAHASTVPGKMHACGHDGHSVMLLGAAEVLAKGDKPDGTLHFVFQPGEEGGAGALRMIEDGLFDHCRPEACFGLHNWPTLPEGRFGICAGPIMAAGCRFRIEINGRGGHAAQPHFATDPITIGCGLVTQLQTLVARRTNPIDAAVVSVCMFNAGVSDNVLPGQAVIRGTIRTLDSHVMAALRDGMQSMAEGFCQAQGAHADVTFTQPYPLTSNSAPEAEFAARIMTDLVGPEAVQNPTPPNMTSEDFGFMLERRPGVYALIGTAAPGRPAHALHTPDYDFNDEVIPLGIAYWCAVAREWWQRPAA